MNNKIIPILRIALGAHRFRTTLHGGHPGVLLIKGNDRNGEFVNGPNVAKNGIDLPLNAGTHTYTI